MREVHLKQGEAVTIICDGQPTAETAQQEPKDKGKLLYKVGLMSDVHFDVEDAHNSEYKTDLQNACEVFVKNGCEFVASCGDFAQYNDADYDEFKDWYGAHGYAKGLRLFTCLGNHDYLRLFTIRKPDDQYADDGALYNYLPMWNNVGEFHNIINPADGKYESDIHFFEHGARWDCGYKEGWRSSKSKLNYWIERHGDIYAFLSIDFGTMVYGDPWDTLSRGINLLDYNDAYVKQMADYVSGTPYDRSKEKNFDYQFYMPEALIWLKGLIEDNKDKRIFVFVHHFMPNGAGEVPDSEYSRLRIWPVPVTDAQKRKYYAGSNTLCGLTYWFIDKLMMENRHAIWFGGHSHYDWTDEEDKISRHYAVKQPEGNEVMPLVDDLNTLKGTEYDYRLYTPVGHSDGDTAVSIHLPSLSKPVSCKGQSLYGASSGAIMEVYEHGVVIKCYCFKEQGETAYSNRIIKEIII